MEIREKIALCSGLRRSSVKRLIEFWIAAAAAVFGATGPATSENGRVEPLLEIVPEEIVGIALYPDGETPVAELPIRVWSQERRRIILRTRTAEDGTFRVPRTAVGPCFLFVGRVKMNLQMLPTGGDGTNQHHDIVVVVPRSLIVGQSLPTAGVITGSSAAGALMTPYAADILIAPSVIKPPPPEPVVSP